MHLGGARWAAVGDALGRVLFARGAAVTREYYFNDAGAQIDRFAESLVAAAQGEPTPENGYGGAYIGEIAEAWSRPSRASPADAERAHDRSGAGCGRDGGRHQARASTRSAPVRRVLLREVAARRRCRRGGRRAAQGAGQPLRDDGAWWLRSTDQGDDKDRLVIKSDGKPAYIAGDIAYYLDKRGRGFEKLIYMLGADHHGYIARLRAVAVAFGDRPAPSRC